ncbi:MAG: hypothetical protein JO152_01450, partial [Mycobacteriaceae bacterium]|nr:hypothetical protein [Mycobacteriaceae bacterium]
ELFYWLAVLVTFALGTATGDWMLELTGWGPGTSVLLPAGLIALIAIGWRLGANPVLSFWLAYILTRPLGANLGDWLGSPSSSHGLGLGTALTSAIFLVAILATVIYLTVTSSDVIEDDDPARVPAVTTTPARERIMLAYFAAAAAAATVAPLAKVQAGDQTGATARIKDLETAWDDDQSTLQPMDETAWHTLDGQIDSALKALRASKPDPATEQQTLTTLLTSLQ